MSIKDTNTFLEQSNIKENQISNQYLQDTSIDAYLEEFRRINIEEPSQAESTIIGSSQPNSRTATTKDSIKEEYKNLAGDFVDSNNSNNLIRRELLNSTLSNRSYFNLAHGEIRNSKTPSNNNVIKAIHSGSLGSNQQQQTLNSHIMSTNSYMSIKKIDSFKSDLSNNKVKNLNYLNNGMIINKNLENNTNNVNNNGNKSSSCSSVGVSQDLEINIKNNTKNNINYNNLTQNCNVNTNLINNVYSNNNNFIDTTGSMNHNQAYTYNMPQPISLNNNYSNFGQVNNMNPIYSNNNIMNSYLNSNYSSFNQNHYIGNPNLYQNTNIYSNNLNSLNTLSTINNLNNLNTMNNLNIQNNTMQNPQYNLYQQQQIPYYQNIPLIYNKNNGNISYGQMNQVNQIGNSYNPLYSNNKMIINPIYSTNNPIPISFSNNTELAEQSQAKNKKINAHNTSDSKNSNTKQKDKYKNKKTNQIISFSNDNEIESHKNNNYSNSKLIESNSILSNNVNDIKEFSLNGNLNFMLKELDRPKTEFYKYIISKQGSKTFQGIISTFTSKKIPIPDEFVFKLLESNFPQIIMEKYSSFLMEKVAWSLNLKQRLIIFKSDSFREHFPKLCCGKYSNIVMQSFIKTMVDKENEEKLFLSLFKSTLHNLSTKEFSNFVMNQVFYCFSVENKRFLYDYIQNNFLHLANYTQYGHYLIKNLIKYLNPNSKLMNECWQTSNNTIQNDSRRTKETREELVLLRDNLIRNTLDSIFFIANHKYGHFVIIDLFEIWGYDYCNEISDMFLDNIFQFWGVVYGYAIAKTIYLTTYDNNLIIEQFSDKLLTKIVDAEEMFDSYFIIDIIKAALICSSKDQFKFFKEAMNNSKCLRATSIYKINSYVNKVTKNNISIKDIIEEIFADHK